MAARAAGMENPSPNIVRGNANDLESAPNLSSPSNLHQSDVSSPNTAPGVADDAQSRISEYAWGPSHPCFPHLNPHVPLDSPLYNSTRIIRIRRDWMVVGDLAPTFTGVYPEVLEPYLPLETFRKVIKKINDELMAAFNPFSARSLIDAILGVATLWLWDDAGFTGVKSRLQALENWIDKWNREVGANDGVQIISLRRTGYLTIDIQIPDPHIEFDNASQASRPVSGAADHPVSPAPQLHGEFGPYPVQDVPSLRHDGQTHLPSGVAVESR